MSTVQSLANMPSSATDTAVKFLDQSKLKPVATYAGSQPSAKNPSFRVQTEYVYADGSFDDTTKVAVTAERIPANAGTPYDVHRNTIKLTTDLELVVDSEEASRTKASVAIVVETDATQPVLDPGALLDMIGTCYSLWFDGVTTKVPNEGTINALSRDITSGLFD
jgi:hypothetical protein